MEEAVNFLKRLYETSAEGIIMIDNKAKILWTNKMVKDFTQVNLEGQNALELLNSEEVLWPPKLNQSIRRNFQGATIEYIVTPIPDTETYIASIRNLDDANGIKKEMEEELEKIMGQFIHDIFTPLNGVLGFLQIIEEDLDPKDEKREFVEAALRAANTMLKGRNNFLAVSRIAKGNHQIELTKVNLFELIRKNKEVFEAGNKIKIVQRPIIGANFEVMANGDLLEIALGNILKNAAEAMQEQGLDHEKIVINFGQKDGIVTISVVNPGRISEDNIKRLFKENFSTKKNGNGFGSRAIRLIVEAHGGNVTVKNLADAVEIEISFPG